MAQDASHDGFYLILDIFWDSPCGENLTFVCQPCLWPVMEFRTGTSGAWFGVNLPVSPVHPLSPWQSGKAGSDQIASYRRTLTWLPRRQSLWLLSCHYNSLSLTLSSWKSIRWYSIKPILTPNMDALQQSNTLEAKIQEVADLRREVDSLKVMYDDLEQHVRRGSMRVVGVPEHTTGTVDASRWCPWAHHGHCWWHCAVPFEPTPEGHPNPLSPRTLK